MVIALVGWTMGCGSEGGDGASTNETPLEQNGPPAETQVPGGPIGTILLHDGVPAPGSECHIDDNGGYEVGDYLKDHEFIDGNGDTITLSESLCGASVGLVYFHYGSG